MTKGVEMLINLQKVVRIRFVIGMLRRIKPNDTFYFVLLYDQLWFKPEFLRAFL